MQLGLSLSLGTSRSSQASLPRLAFPSVAFDGADQWTFTWESLPAGTTNVQRRHSTDQGQTYGFVPGVQSTLVQTITFDPGDATEVWWTFQAFDGDAQPLTTLSLPAIYTIGAAPSILASVSRTGNTVTISVDSLIGDPTPTAALTTLTLDGVDVSGDATGSGPWTYIAPDSAAAATVAGQVTATNAVDTATDGFSIAVPATLFAPSTMSAPTITATSDTAISVDLAAAPNDGGSAITSYDLRYSTDQENWTTITGVSDPQAVTGLSASTTYYVQARALNAVGAADWSPSGSATTAAADTAPSAFTSAMWTLADSPSAGGDTLSITINSLPANGGSAITDVEYQIDSGSGYGAWTSLGATSGTHTITVLAETAATVMLRAVNAIGNGPNGDEKTATPTVAVNGIGAFGADDWSAVSGGVDNGGQMKVYIVPHVRPQATGNVQYGWEEIRIDEGSGFGPWQELGPLDYNTTRPNIHRVDISTAPSGNATIEIRAVGINTSTGATVNGVAVSKTVTRVATGDTTAAAAFNGSGLAPAGRLASDPDAGEIWTIASSETLEEGFDITIVNEPASDGWPIIGYIVVINKNGSAVIPPTLNVMRSVKELATQPETTAPGVAAEIKIATLTAPSEENHAGGISFGFAGSSVSPGSGPEGVPLAPLEFDWMLLPNGRSGELTIAKHREPLDTGSPVTHYEWQYIKIDDLTSPYGWLSSDNLSDRWDDVVDPKLEGSDGETWSTPAALTFTTGADGVDRATLTGLPAGWVAVRWRADNANGVGRWSVRKLEKSEDWTQSTIEFGELTGAGEAAALLPAGTTGIASGDPSSHFQVSNGFLSLTAAGATAIASGDSYTLGLTPSGSVTVNIVAGVTTGPKDPHLPGAIDSGANDLARLLAIKGASGIGNLTVHQRPGWSNWLEGVDVDGSSGDLDTLFDTPANPVTITRAHGAVAPRISVIRHNNPNTTPGGLHVMGVNIHLPAAAIYKWRENQGSGVFRGSTLVGSVQFYENIRFSSCRFSTDAVPPRFGWVNYIRSDHGTWDQGGNDLIFEDCLIEFLTYGPNPRGDNARVERCEIRHVIGDFINPRAEKISAGRANRPHVIVENNYFHSYMGDQARIHSDTAHYWQGSAGREHMRLTMRGTVHRYGRESDLAIPQVNAGIYQSPATSRETASRLITLADERSLKLTDASGGAITFTLPSVASMDTSDESFDYAFVIRKIDETANSITVVPGDAADIRLSDGATWASGFDWNTQWQTVTFRLEYTSQYGWGWTIAYGWGAMQGILFATNQVEAGEGIDADVDISFNALDTISSRAVYLPGEVRGAVLNNTALRPLFNTVNDQERAGQYSGLSSLDYGSTLTFGRNIGNGGPNVANSGLGMHHDFYDGSTAEKAIANRFMGDQVKGFDNWNAETDGPGITLAGLPTVFGANLPDGTRNSRSRGEFLALYRPQAGTEPATNTLGAIGPTDDAPGFWNFATGTPNAYPAAPTIQTLNPADGVNAPLGEPLTVSFDMPVKPGTGNITLKNLTDATEEVFDVTSSAALSWEGNSIVITPQTEVIAGGKNYAVQIDATAVERYDGAAFAGISDDTTWNFTGDGSVIANLIGVTDFADTAVWLNPSNNFVTPTAPSGTTPDGNPAYEYDGTGNALANRIEYDSDNAPGFVMPDTTGPFTVSIMFKAGTQSSTLRFSVTLLNPSGTTNSAVIDVDLATGAVAGWAFNGATADAYSVEDAGSGWWRVRFTWAANGVTPADADRIRIGFLQADGTFQVGEPAIFEGDWSPFTWTAP